jgi:hypothetical protein
VENGRILFQADLVRGDKYSAISFEILLEGVLAARDKENFPVAQQLPALSEAERYAIRS